MDPVLVVLISPSHECVHCEALMKIWHKITEVLLSIYPKLKFPQTTIDTKHHKYPPIMIKDKKISSVFPKDLSNYCGQWWSWSPMTILIPGESWQKAKDGSKLENIHIMNSKMANGIMHYDPIWNTKDPNQFGLWLKETLPKTQIPIKFFPSIIEKINNPEPKKDVCQPILNIISR